MGTKFLYYWSERPECLKTGGIEEGGKKKTEQEREKQEGVGNGVLSHTVTRAVPSALVSLTAGFGMGPGVPSRL
jgi:hypothetical protein